MPPKATKKLSDKEGFFYSYSCRWLLLTLFHLFLLQQHRKSKITWKLFLFLHFMTFSFYFFFSFHPFLFFQLFSSWNIYGTCISATHSPVREHKRCIANTQQNRPFNEKMLFENLHGVVGLTQVKKILANLVESKFLVCKENKKQKVFWYNQDLIPDVNKDDLANLDKKEEDLKASIAKEKDELDTITKSILNFFRLLIWIHITLFIKANQQQSILFYKCLLLFLMLYFLSN